MASLLESPVIGRIAAVAGRGDSWLWRASCVALAALIPFVTGFAFEWDVRFSLIGALAFGLTAWLARSLVRAVLCGLAALGILAALVAVLLAAGSDVPATLRLEWSWVAYAYWVVIPLLALAWRRAAPDVGFGAAEVVGGIASVLIAAVLVRRVDFTGDLLALIVAYEDNEAWVRLVTQSSGSPALGPGFDELGPVIPLVLGLLSHWQAATISPYNAVYAAFMLAVIIAPMMAVGLVRSSGRSLLPSAGFAAAIVLWAVQLPIALYLSWGHLTASWAYLFVLAAAGLIALERRSVWSAPVAAAALYAAGAVWFPLIPLALAGSVWMLACALRADRGGARIAAAAIYGAAALLLSYQVAYQTLGLRPGGAVSTATGALSGLYAAKGGTASLDGALQLAVLVGIAAIAFVPASRLGPGLRVWGVAIAGVLYVAAVFGGSHILRVAVGYGPTKVWYVVGFAVVVLLIAIAAHAPMPPRATIGVIVALLVGSLFYGGAGPLLSRTWIGEPTFPAWLPGLRDVAAREAPDSPTPIACVGADDYQAYLCTRWAGGLSLSGDETFMGYRLRVVNTTDQAAEVERLRADGTLAKSTVFIIDDPGPERPWAWDMIRNAGSVTDASGAQLDDRPTESSIPGAE